MTQLQVNQAIDNAGTMTAGELAQLAYDASLSNATRESRLTLAHLASAAFEREVMAR